MLLFLAREVWKKKYYEAKKQTPALEGDCQKLRTELDAIHKKHLAALENIPLDGKQKVCTCIRLPFASVLSVAIC